MLSQICDLPAAIVVYVLPHAQVGMGPHMKEGVKEWNMLWTQTLIA